MRPSLAALVCRWPGLTSPRISALSRLSSLLCGETDSSSHRAPSRQEPRGRWASRGDRMTCVVRHGLGAMSARVTDETPRRDSTEINLELVLLCYY